MRLGGRTCRSQSSLLFLLALSCRSLRATLRHLLLSLLACACLSPPVALSSVNSLHPSVMSGLAACYKEACDDSSIKAVVITGAGSSFVAGADIEYVAGMQRKAGVTKS